MKLTNAPESSHRLSWNAVLNFKLHSYAKTRIDFIVESFVDTLQLSLDSRLPQTRRNSCKYAFCQTRVFDAQTVI